MAKKGEARKTGGSLYTLFFASLPCGRKKGVPKKKLVGVKKEGKAVVKSSLRHQQGQGGGGDRRFKDTLGGGVLKTSIIKDKKN